MSTNIDEQLHIARQTVYRLENQKKREAEQEAIAQRKHEAKERLEFFAKLAKAHGLENHPKLHRLENMAWDRGHANGYAEVEMEYDELADLMKP